MENINEDVDVCSRVLEKVMPPEVDTEEKIKEFLGF